MKFCSKCDNMYYIKISNDKLVNYCRKCKHTEDMPDDSINSICVSKTHIKHKQGRYCVHISGNLCGKRRHLIRIPHLSRFAINSSKHKPIIEWIRSLINNREKFYPVMG